MVSNRDYAKTQIDSLPDGVVEKIIEFISFQKYSLGLSYLTATSIWIRYQVCLSPFVKD